MAMERVIENTPRFLVFAVRCKHCSRVLAELAGGDYVIKCTRCGWWNTRNGAAESREKVVDLKKSA